MLSHKRNADTRREDTRREDTRLEFAQKESNEMESELETYRFLPFACHRKPLDPTPVSILSIKTVSVPISPSCLPHKSLSWSIHECERKSKRTNMNDVVWMKVQIRLKSEL